MLVVMMWEGGARLMVMATTPKIARKVKRKLQQPIIISNDKVLYGACMQRRRWIKQGEGEFQTKGRNDTSNARPFLCVLCWRDSFVWQTETAT
jgi:hypothetical protein